MAPACVRLPAWQCKVFSEAWSPHVHIHNCQMSSDGRNETWNCLFYPYRTFCLERPGMVIRFLLTINLVWRVCQEHEGRDATDLTMFRIYINGWIPRGEAILKSRSHFSPQDLDPAQKGFLWLLKPVKPGHTQSLLRAFAPPIQFICPIWLMRVTHVLGCCWEYMCKSTCVWCFHTVLERNETALPHCERELLSWFMNIIIYKTDKMSNTLGKMANR